MNKLLQVAISQIGIQEDPAHKNMGEAAKYQESVGLGKQGGYPWCMSLVYWCGLQAYGVANPVPRTGGVLECLRRARAANSPHIIVIEKRSIQVRNIQPGDQFILDHGKGTGHTGIIESCSPTGKLTTIEGNSNDDGSRDGYKVCRLTKRNTIDKNLVAIIRYVMPD